jgi:hypothetical protein
VPPVYDGTINQSERATVVSEIWKCPFFTTNLRENGNLHLANDFVWSWGFTEDKSRVWMNTVTNLSKYSWDKNIHFIWTLLLSILNIDIIRNDNDANLFKWNSW